MFNRSGSCFGSFETADWIDLSRYGGLPDVRINRVTLTWFALFAMDGMLVA